MTTSMDSISPAGDAPLLQMRGMTKSFDGQCVLHSVDFNLHAGEVHILAGENGAGKSTLIKLLGGVHQPDAGEVRIAGRPVRFRSPREASAGGVAIIHQELSLVPDMSVADNIFLGRERSSLGWMRRRDQWSQATNVLARLGLCVDAGQTIASLPIAMQQMVEIAKALSYNARILVMDEPTSALNGPEVERLFETIADLKSQGCGIIYITHKLEEVYRIADRITVLRDGKWIADATAEQMPADALIRNMVGRELSDDQLGGAREIHSETPVCLTVENLTVRAAEKRRKPVVEDLNFSVREGEIVGLAGVQGSGASEALLALFGAFGRRVSGAIRVGGRPYQPLNPRQAIQRGLALVTNDRQRSGLVSCMGVAENATLASLARVSPGGWLSEARQLRLAYESTQALHLRAASLAQPVSTLSGGNQQKVVLAKWLNTEPRVLLLDEPTRGVDVGAKQEIYALMNEWRATGRGLVLITSEMPELLLMSDRIVVMHRGRCTARFDRGEATQENILHAAMGGEDLAA